jgi:hypothetical protein
MIEQVADSQEGQSSEAIDNQIDTTSQGGDQAENHTSWLESIVSDELRTNKSISNFRDVDNLAKGYINLEKKLGSPTPSPIEPAKSYSVEDYLIEIPAGDKQANTESILAPVKAKAAELGIDPKAFQELMGTYFDGESNISKSAQDKEDAKASEEQNKAESLLKEEWGESFDEKINLADATWQRFAPKEYDDMLNTLDPSGKAAIARVMSNIGESISEPHMGKQSDNSLTRESIENRIKELSDSDSFNRGELESVDEVFNLYSQLNTSG